MAEQKKTGATVMQTVRVLVVNILSVFLLPQQPWYMENGLHVLICIKNPLKSNGLSWMINRPAYPIISKMHPQIMLPMNPHVFVLAPCQLCISSDKPKIAMGTAVEAILGWYRRRLASRGQVSRVQLALGPNVTSPLGRVTILPDILCALLFGGV